MSSILVVDDEDQIRRLVCETLEQAGYHVTEARDGKEALQQYRQGPADLVIMDILMPNQDGLETTVVLRREYPDVKIIVITGQRHDWHSQLSRCRQNDGRSQHTSKAL